MIHSLRTRGLGLLGAGLGFLPLLAEAHPDGAPGHTHTDFTSGLAHALSGWDHLLAMLALGFWAAQLGGRARWLAPVALTAMLGLGAVAGSIGLALTPTQQWIALAVPFLGVLLLAVTRCPLPFGVGLAVIYAFGHGYVHAGASLGAASNLLFQAGLLTGALILQASGGALAGKLREEHPGFLRAGGVALMIAAVLLAGS